MRRNISESYKRLPRITSTYNRYYYDMIVELSELIDFNHPVFRGKSVRNRSLGSVQMLLVEIALQNDEVLQTLKKYMIWKGRDWTPVNFYGMKKY